MNKIIITLTTDADVMLVNRHMNILLNNLIGSDIVVSEYTIQKGR